MKTYFLLFPNILLEPHVVAIYQEDKRCIYSGRLTEQVSQLVRDSFVITHDLSFAPECIAYLRSAKTLVDLKYLNQLVYGNNISGHFKNTPILMISNYKNYFIKDREKYLIDYAKNFYEELSQKDCFDTELCRYCAVEEPLMRLLLENYSLKNIFLKRSAREAAKYVREKKNESLRDRIKNVSESIKHNNYGLESRNNFYLSALDLLLTSLPRVDVFGTSSGRVMLRSPAVQFLPEPVRILLSKPKIGNYLVDSDYRAFEPRILSSLADDNRLSQDIDSDTLYTKAAEIMVSSPNRAVGKFIFLSTIYGISNDNLNLCLERLGFQPNKKSGVKRIKKEYHKSWTWMERTYLDVEKQGFVSSPLGNHRKAFSFYSPESCANHILQSTGSLIFKKALIEILSMHNVILKIPLHDGLLLEANEKSAQNSVRKILKANFKSVLGCQCNVVSKVHL